jgi:hypothetical protein
MVLQQTLHRGDNMDLSNNTKTLTPEEIKQERIKRLSWEYNGHLPSRHKGNTHSIEVTKDSVIITKNAEEDESNEAATYSGFTTIPLKGSYTVAPTQMPTFSYPLDGQLYPDDQSQYGTCVPYSINQAMEIMYYRGTGYADSGDVTFCTQWIYGNRSGMYGQEEGMYSDETLARLVRDGVPLNTDIKALRDSTTNQDLYDNLDELAYQQHNYSTDDGSGYTARMVVSTCYNAVIGLANKYRPKAYYELSPGDITSIKNALVTLSPVLIGMDASNVDYVTQVAKDYVLDKYHNAGEGYNLWGDYIFHLRSGSHQIIIVGWKIINNRECFIIKNSWSSLSGDKGYFYIPTSIMSSVVNEAYCIQFNDTVDTIKFVKQCYYKAIDSFYGNTSTYYAKGKPISKVMFSDIFNNLTYYINAKRVTVGLPSVSIDWSFSKGAIKASLFNTLKNAFNEYSMKKYSKNLINIPDKKSGDPIVGTDIWNFFDIIEKNL